MKPLRFVFLVAGLFFFTSVLGLGLGNRPVLGQDEFAEDFVAGFGDFCCACIAEDCCLLVPADFCDDQGNIINGEGVDTFLAIFGTTSANVCQICGDSCDENQLSPEEDAQFLMVCDICVFEPLLERLHCTDNMGFGGNDAGQDSGAGAEGEDAGDGGGGCSLQKGR